MNNEEKFKDSVRNLLDERQFSYDPSDWDEANRILDKKEKRKKRLLWFLFLGLGFGVALMTYILISGSDKDNLSEVNTGDKTVSQPVLKDQGNRDLNLPEEQAAIKKPENTIKSSTASQNINSGDSPGHVKQPVVSQKSSSAKVEITQRARLTKAENVLAEGKIKDGSIIVGMRKKEKTQSTNEGANNMEKEQVTFPDKNKRSETPMDTVSQAENKANTDNHRDEAEVLPETVPLTQIETPKPILTQTDAPEPILTQTDAPEPVALSQTIAPQLRDTVVNTVQQPSKNGFHMNSTLYAEAGIFTNTGWKYQDTREGVSINPYVGLSYLAGFGPKSGFSIGLYYTSLAKLKLDTKVIKSSKIVYGEESDVTEITPATLNYLFIPARFQYKLDTKQIITAGCNIGYLLDVQSNVVTYTERVGQREDEKSFKSRGYMKGFSSINTQITVGYRRLLYKNLWINGDVIYGLTDVRDNTFFRINFHERMTGVKISLTYDLLKK